MHGTKFLSRCHPACIRPDAALSLNAVNACLRRKLGGVSPFIAAGIIPGITVSVNRSGPFCACPADAYRALGPIDNDKNKMI